MSDFEHKVIEFIGETNATLGRVEEDLRDHKEGVIQNRGRIEALEAPRVALREIKKWALWVVAVGGALAIIYKVVG